MTSAATSPAATSSGKPPSCKKGAGYNDVEFANALSICWAYNWSPVAGGTLRDGIQYWPMLWGEKQTSGWNEAAEAAIQAGASVVLGFNEPDLAEQSNMDTQKAADLWKTQIEPLKRDGLKLVSPAVTNGVKTDDGKPIGVSWLQDFLSKCSGCSIDGVALHWYDSATNVDYFKNHLTQSYNTLKLPIYLTEFMGTGDDAQKAAFLNTVLPWLEDQTFIAYYAAFGAFSDNPLANFFDADGQLNDLGKAYNG